MKSLFWLTVHSALEPRITRFTGAFVDVSILHTSAFQFIHIVVPFYMMKGIYSSWFEHVIVIRSVDATAKMCFLIYKTNLG